MNRSADVVLRRLLLAVWVFFAVFPVYWTIVTAFKSQVDIFQGPNYIPFVDFSPTLLSWETLFGEMRDDFLKGLFNSILLSSVSAFLAVLLGAFAAYGLARYDYRYGFYRNNDISFLIVSQRIMPPIVSVLALFLIYRDLRLLDSRVGMILAYTAFNMPIAVFLLRNFFAAIPVELEQAAAVDGYGKVQQLLRVVFPLAAPGLAAAYMLAFFFAWNDFLFALILTFDRAATLPITITNLSAQMQPMWWLVSAVGLVAIIPPALVAVFLDRFMQRQVLRGGIR